MAKTKPGKKDLDSYSIKGTNKVVRRNTALFASMIVLVFISFLYLINFGFGNYFVVCL